MSVIQTKDGEIKTKDGLFKVFYNFFDCPDRWDCEGQEAREKELGKIFSSKIGRCSFNPSIYDCEFYKGPNPKTGPQKTHDLNCL